MSDGLLRRIYRCNAPNVHIAVIKKTTNTDGETHVSVREKKRPSVGYGSVSVFYSATMDVMVYRYKLKYAYRVLEAVLCGVTSERVYLHTDFDIGTAESMLDSVRRMRGEE
jgi:hypothetical protein